MIEMGSVLFIFFSLIHNLHFFPSLFVRQILLSHVNFVNKYSVYNIQLSEIPSVSLIKLLFGVAFFCLFMISAHYSNQGCGQTHLAHLPSIGLYPQAWMIKCFIQVRDLISGGS